MKKILIVFLGNIKNDSRSFKIYKSLKEAGYIVKVICAAEPNEPIIESNDEVIHIKLRKFRRALFKILSFYFKSLPLIIKICADIVISSDLFSLPIAWLISVKCNAKMIYDSREFYSSLASTKNRRFVQKIISLFEEIFTLRCSVILTVNQSIAKLISSKFEKPIFIVRNFPTVKWKSEKTFIYKKQIENALLYLGLFHQDRGFDIYFELIQRLSFEFNDIKLLIVGKGELKNLLLEEIQKRNLESKVEILGPYSPDEEIKFPNIKKIVGLCIIKPVSLSYFFSLPNKIFEYIQAKIPFIASDLPEIRAIIETYKVGILVDPSNISEIVESTRKLLTDHNLYLTMRDHCERATRELTWENEIKSLLDVLEIL
ncbi:Glycosyltransferase involved in cell wall bisynthesis [Candidatus Thermokryptus mobilis]|uniref:Glycosyltransferase involved in cell wall bisynthesis n=1 Tax=Candidatus Thermokryptus mobilis TaxID=1643428 RepID=A0A0S4N5J3_9BACT|nr:glycosyltransferase [Candidatus Thermokryptus mobilis]CUU05423.1 Glycosyltransferase involved in cell wall bisynthesis [Candidatus Thermokryptus mobilis]